MVNLWVTPFALAGLAISAYIFHKKRKNERLACLLGDDCDKVVRSTFSAVLGLPNEVLGMAYYLFVLILAGLSAVGLAGIAGVSLSLVLLITGGLASIFSLFLLYPQAFILKAWCEYCVTSTILTIAIFLVELAF